MNDLGLQFPCLLFLPKGVVPVTEREAFASFFSKQIDARHLLLKNGSSRELIPSSIVERTGQIRSISVKRVTRLWAKPLAGLKDFTLALAEIGPSTSVNVSELNNRLGAASHGWDRHLRVGPRFRRYVAELDRNAMFSERLLQLFFEMSISNRCP